MPTKKNTPKKSKPKTKKKPNNSTVYGTLAADTSAEVPGHNSTADRYEHEATPRVDNSHEWHAPIYTAEYVAQQRDVAHYNGKIEAEDRYFLWGMLVSSIAWVFVGVIVWVFHG